MNSLSESAEITSWNEIQEDFSDGTLLLGNGASICVDSRFRYKSLYDKAIEEGYFDNTIDALFKEFKTDDFELVMRMLWHAYIVNKTLNSNNPKVTELYESIKTGLINVVQKTHCDYTEVETPLRNAAIFCRKFSTILSLNYDLLLYWIMQKSNEEYREHRFKDCFVSGKFDHDWGRLREPYRGARKTTLVFWPHGNLMIAEHPLEGESKVHAGRYQTLRSKIFDEWTRNNCKPVFVSEGKSEQKMRAIRRSDYLRGVYFDALSNLTDKLVIYGWGMGDNDSHILRAIVESQVTNIAVSVFNLDENKDVECNDILAKINSAKSSSTNNRVRAKRISVKFFDAQDTGVWSN